jgi:hypothetical protein
VAKGIASDFIAAYTAGLLVQFKPECWRMFWADSIQASAYVAQITIASAVNLLQAQGVNLASNVFICVDQNFDELWIMNMQFFNREATGQFLAEQNRGSTPEVLDKEFFDHGFYQARFRIPVEAGKLLSLCRNIFDQKRTSAWTLIIVESGGIWPSCEDKNLYGMIRQARGVTTDTGYGDAYMFDPIETADMVSFSYIFASFRYDFRIIDADREIHIFFSHDDYFFLQVAKKFGSVLGDTLNVTEEWSRSC